jgi:MerR family transcriptional regulator, heat shock protein HspR
MSNPYELSDDMPVYVISVAAQLSDMHPQTLRAYDRLGLVSPGRSQGRGRRYSMRDILALREIQRLSREGVNLNGIKMLLDQHRELEQARRLVAELHAEVAQLRVELESTRAVAARLAELRRSGSDTRSGGEGREGLVPVRSARVAVWEPIAGPSGESGPPRGDK